MDCNHRVWLACQHCRQKKRKCDGARPTCGLCQQRSIPCVYGTRQPSSQHTHIRKMQAEIGRLTSLVEALSEKHIPTANLEASQQEQNARLAPDLIQSSIHLNLTSDATREVSQWAQPKLSPSNIGSTSIYSLSTGFDLPTRSNLDSSGSLHPTWPSYVYDLDYRQATYECFMNEINATEHLLEDDCLLELDLSLNQRLDSVLLLLAVISAATVIRGELKIGDAVTQAVELWILNAAGIPGSTLTLIRALTILAWRELTVAGSENRAWLFICLAAGMLQQLGVFDWTKLHIEQTRYKPQHRAQVATFWAFSHVDRICTALLGRSSTIPWQRILIPRYSSLFESSGVDSMTIEGLYFDHLWSLWERQGYYMHAIYSPRFSTLPAARRQDLLFDCRQALMSMRSSINPRLSFDSSNFTSHHPFIYFLHMAIEISPIILLLPFLNNADKHQKSSLLQEMLRSAYTVTDILFRYRKSHKLVKCPAMLVYYVVRSSVFLLLLATSNDPALDRRAARNLKVSLESLEEMQGMWQQQSSRAISFLQGLAARWGVLRVLPMRFSYPPEVQSSLQIHHSSFHERTEMSEASFDVSSIGFEFANAGYETIESTLATEDIFRFFSEESASQDYWYNEET